MISCCLRRLSPIRINHFLSLSRNCFRPPPSPSHSLALSYLPLYLTKTTLRVNLATITTLRPYLTSQFSTGRCRRQPSSWKWPWLKREDTAQNPLLLRRGQPPRAARCAAQCRMRAFMSPSARWLHPAPHCRRQPFTASGSSTSPRRGRYQPYRSTRSNACLDGCSTWRRASAWSVARVKLESKLWRSRKSTR